MVALVFAEPTDRAGAALGAPISRAELERLFAFVPPIASDAVVDARWTSDAVLNITFVSAGSAPIVPSVPGALASSRVSCKCDYEVVGHCRDAGGIHYTRAHLAGADELSCNVRASTADPATPRSRCC